MACRLSHSIDQSPDCVPHVEDPLFARISLVPALALVAMTAWSPAPAPTPTPPTGALLDDGAPPAFVERAEMSAFFCFFVYVDQDGAASGYSGESHAVITPSGNTNYKCDASLLFGPGVFRADVFSGVTFNTFDLGPLAPCTVRFTPGDNAFANCAAQDG